MKARELRTLLGILRASGVTRYKADESGNVELQLSPFLAAPVARARDESPEAQVVARMNAAGVSLDVEALRDLAATLNVA